VTRFAFQYTPERNSSGGNFEFWSCMCATEEEEKPREKVLYLPLGDQLK
jgi:hypothetical protein